MPGFPETNAIVSAMSRSVYNALAHRLETHPGEVYPLHVGDTWMEPPEGCRMEDLRVGEHPGMHRYSPVQGLPTLLDAVVERVRDNTGLDIERDQVLVTAGATGGLGAVAGALLDPDDEVLILAPYWPLIAGIVRTFGGRPIPVPYFVGGAEEPEAVEALVTERTVALYLNTPSNPTGRLLSVDAVAALAEVARRHGLWLWADEVYEHYSYAAPHVPALPLAHERTFAAYSFSKAYGMAGNRCGYVVGPRKAMPHLRKVSTHSFYATPTAGQLAALRALRGPGDAWAADAARRYAEVGAEAARRLGLPAPQGSTFLFFDVSALLDDRGLQGLLFDLADEGLFIAPGTSFGPYPTHVRLCYTSAPPDVVLRGVDVLARRLRAGPG